jgi:hypothetical protein
MRIIAAIVVKRIAINATMCYNCYNEIVLRRINTMLKKHNQYIKDLISARTEEVIQKISCTNKRYRELTAAIGEAQRELTDQLPPPAQTLVDSYEEADSEQEAIVIPAVYRQGFLDGVKAARLLTRYGVVHKFFGR